MHGKLVYIEIMNINKCYSVHLFATATQRSKTKIKNKNSHVIRIHETRNIMLLRKVLANGSEAASSFSYNLTKCRDRKDHSL
jgi:hypothetical protein